MLKTIEIDTYIIQKDYLGGVADAGKLHRELREEIRRAGYKGIPSYEQTSDLEVKALYSSVITHAFVDDGGLRKGTIIFVWK